MNQRAAIYTLHGEDTCATIRLLSPLLVAGIDIYKPNPALEIDEPELRSCDFIIIQRSYPKQFDQYLQIMDVAHETRVLSGTEGIKEFVRSIGNCTFLTL